LEQECGENRKNIMNKKTTYYDDDARYTDAPSDVEEAFARSVRIKDFLPAPEFLERKTKKEQVAVLLDSDILAFFRKYAQQEHTTYQNVMSSVLKNYAKDNASLRIE